MNAASLYTNVSVPTTSLEVANAILFVILPFAAILGFFTGRRQRKVVLAANKQVDHFIGETTLAAILALLGLLLAFSFGNALNLTETRKSALVNEAAALGTAFLRADYLNEPDRTELQEAILDYSRTRLLPEDDSLATLSGIQAFLSTTLDAQAVLWPLTVAATSDPVAPPIKTFVASAMNEALDAHLVRMKTLSQPVSETTMLMIVMAALASLFLLGNRAGLMGRSLTWRTFVFSGFLFVVIVTILDTQRSNEGFARVDDTALRATIFDMEQALAARG